MSTLFISLHQQTTANANSYKQINTHVMKELLKSNGIILLEGGVSVEGQIKAREAALAHVIDALNRGDESVSKSARLEMKSVHEEQLEVLHGLRV